MVGLIAEGDRIELKVATEQADVIKNLGFGESLIMLILASLLSIIVIICGFFLIYTVYFRFLKLLVIVPLGSIAFSSMISLDIAYFIMMSGFIWLLIIKKQNN